MAIRPLIVVLPVALGLGLAACDNRDYEGEIGDLQNQLGDANSQLETLRSENQQLNSELEDLRTQAEQATNAAGNLGTDVADRVKNQLETALDKATLTVDRLAALEREPTAPAETREQAVGILHEDVQQIADSLQAVAADLGLELQGGGVEPAAGTETQASETPRQQPAGGQGQPEAGQTQQGQPQQ